VGACATTRIEREEALGRGGGVRERTRDDSCD
jgi:hypothetical protein